MADISGTMKREMAELNLRREQMSRLPFCPDHRDKVFGLQCRECEIERLRRQLERILKAQEIGTAHTVAEIALYGFKDAPNAPELTRAEGVGVE